MRVLSIAAALLTLWTPLRPPGDLTPYVEAVQRGRCGGDVLAPLGTLAARPDAMGARAAFLLATCLQRTGRLREARGAFED
ncbi:MAG TPA: hypothetical protein VGR24_10445, partial [bacterium]|nr:hypothetical protein [bacterium]